MEIGIVYLILFLGILFASGVFQCASDVDKDQHPAVALRGEYLGQALPDTVPKIFAPGIVSTNLNERDAVFSPDGNEFYFTLWSGKFGTIVFVKQENGQWLPPLVASFSGKYSDLEPFVATDGKRLYFASNRPLEAGGEAKDYDIWFVEREGERWGEPKNIGAPVNTGKNEFYPVVTANGNLYFTTNREGSKGGDDIFLSRFHAGKYLAAVNLGVAINSKSDEFNAFVAADESMIVFSAWGRDDGLGRGDLYISFKNSDGDWQAAKNMGAKINSPALDYCPSISPDGKYFFFTSRRSAITRETNVPRTYQQLTALLNQPGNGNDDIYWVDSGIFLQFNKGLK